MLRHFKDSSSLPTRAHQIWLILIGAARNRQMLNYGIIADILGYGGPSPVIRPLGHIMYWCSENRLPPLTTLVVNQETGEPGGGLTTGGPKDLESVYSYPWYSIFPPSPEELAQAYQRGQEAASKKNPIDQPARR
jgi:hypothetical protein